MENMFILFDSNFIFKRLLYGKKIKNELGIKNSFGIII